MVASKLIGEMSDKELQNLMTDRMLKAEDIQEAAELKFRERGPSLEEATECWWAVFGARFQEKPLPKTRLALEAAKAQEIAESEFRTYCFTILGVKHGMDPEDIFRLAGRSWWDVFGMAPRLC